MVPVAEPGRERDPHDHRQHRAGLVNLPRPVARQRGGSPGRGQGCGQPVAPAWEVPRRPPGWPDRTRVRADEDEDRPRRDRQHAHRAGHAPQDDAGAGPGRRGGRWAGPISGILAASLACLAPSVSSPADRSCPLRSLVSTARATGRAAGSGARQAATTSRRSSCSAARSCGPTGGRPSAANRTVFAQASRSAAGVAAP